MKQKKLGCLTTGGLIAVLISLIAVGASYAFTHNRIFSPGLLNSQSRGKALSGITSHAELEGDCAACHTAPWDSVSMSDLCIECHRNVSDQLADVNSLHGAVMANMSSINCRECHTDHNGPDASMTEFLGGELPHELVGFALQSHDQIDWDRKMVCADCHQNGFRNFEMLVCIDCHEGVDAAYMAAHTTLFSTACLDCHDGIETYGADFDHNLHMFPLEGQHEILGCEGCHQGAETLVMLQNTPQACESCHLEDDAHQKLLGEQCGVCHTSEGWKPALFDHSGTGFELVGGHAEVSCENCHLDATFQGADPTCISCHGQDDQHQGQFGTECTLCHTVFSWEDVDFDHSGAYAQDCIACHQSDSPVNHYPGQCSACHNTAGWLPATFNHQVAGATDCLACHTSDRPINHFPGQCSTCHNTSAWKPASFSHTFPMNHEGANEQCSLCHTTANYSQYTCYGCHEHSAAEVSKEHEGIPDLNNCIRCHWDGREHDEDGGGGGGGNNNNDDD